MPDKNGSNGQRLSLYVNLTTIAFLYLSLSPPPSLFISLNVYMLISQLDDGAEEGHSIRENLEVWDRYLVIPRLMQGR